MQVDYLLGAWLSGGEEESKVVRERLEEKLDAYAAGQLGHAVDAVVCIWGASHKGEPASSGSPDFASRSAKISTVSLADQKFTGCDIRYSLVKSIKNGNLLDRKYWAKRSREGAIEPIYFSNAVILAELPCFDACKSPHPGLLGVLNCVVLGRHLGSGGRLDENDENEYIEDSDYEDEPERVDEPVSQDTEANPEGKEEQKLLSVLRVGSSAA